MKILAVDTASQSCGVAIVQDDRLLSEITVNTGDTHSRHVLRLIDAALDFSGLTLKNMDAYAVTTGPGSFTGLRIGLSLIKGMALSDQKRIIGISSLDALAWQCDCHVGSICVLMDARRKEVYCSQYHTEKDSLKRTVEATVTSPEKAISNIDGQCAFIGSGAILHHELIVEKMGDKAFFPSPSSHLIRASSVAFLGVRQLENHFKMENRNLVPEYLRASDAEIKKDQKN